MSIQCRDCLAGLEHCHGTVIHHVRYRAECTDDGCTTPESAHTFSVDCESVGCPCGRDIALAIWPAQPIGSGARSASSTGRTADSG